MSHLLVHIYNRLLEIFMFEFIMHCGERRHSSALPLCLNSAFKQTCCMYKTWPQRLSVLVMYFARFSPVRDSNLCPPDQEQGNLPLYTGLPPVHSQWFLLILESREVLLLLWHVCVWAVPWRRSMGGCVCWGHQCRRWLGPFVMGPLMMGPYVGVTCTYKALVSLPSSTQTGFRTQVLLIKSKALYQRAS